MRPNHWQKIIWSLCLFSTLIKLCCCWSKHTNETSSFPFNKLAIFLFVLSNRKLYLFVVTTKPRLCLYSSLWQFGMAYNHFQQTHEPKYQNHNNNNNNAANFSSSNSWNKRFFCFATSNLVCGMFSFGILLIFCSQKFMGHFQKWDRIFINHKKCWQKSTISHSNFFLV